MSTQLNGSHATRALNPDRFRYGNNHGLTQAYEIRNLAAKEAVAIAKMPAKTLDQKLARAKALQALSVVWLGASDRIRILRGRPLPGSKRPAPEAPKPKHKPQPTGPLEE